MSLVPLAVIVIGELFKIFFFEEVRQISGHEQDFKKYIDLANLVQLFLSPFMGFVSDKFGRRLLIVATLGCLCLSAFFLKAVPSLNLAVWLYGIGTVTPIARAAYCDVHITNKRVPNIINTFIVQPIPWLIVYKISFTNWISFSTILSIGLLTIVLVYFYFKDNEDHSKRKTSFEFENIKREYGWGLCLRILIAFSISNCLWNMLQYYFEETGSVHLTAGVFSLSQGAMFFLGCVIARLLDIEVKKILGLIFVFTAILLSVQSLQWALEGYGSDIVPSIFATFTFFGGIILPSLYAFFGRKADIHEQGVLYGLLESIQTLTESAGAYSVSHSKTLEDPKAILLFVLIGSLMSLVLTSNLIRTKWKNIR